MSISYFKPRKLFSFSPHPFDIGTFVGLLHSYDDNHFLLKIFKIDEKEFAAYYSYHLNYALENGLVNEEEFFRHVWQIVKIRIKHFEIQNPFSKNHGIYKNSLKRLQQFEKYLKDIDIWDARPSRMVIQEKENIIQRQKQTIEELQARLDELKVFEVSQKIRIEEGYVATFIHLLKQIEQLQLPSGRKLILSDHQIVYPRMIGKYFSDGGDDLSVETLRNYYVSKKANVPSKGTEIRAEHKLFKILPINPVAK